MRRPFPEGLAQASLFRLSEKRFDVLFEFREASFHGIPNGLQTNAKILMDEHIAQSGNPGPWDLRMAGAQIRRKILYRFSDDLQITDHCILDHARAEKNFLPPGCIGFDTHYSIADMVQINRSSFIGA